MKKSIVYIFMTIICVFVVECSKTTSIDFPFEISNVENIEMFHFTIPANAEKKVITKQEDIEVVYKLPEKISLKDKSTEPKMCCKGLFYVFSILGQNNSEQLFFDCSLSPITRFSKKLVLYS